MLKKIIQKLRRVILINSYSTKELIKIYGGKIDEDVFFGKDVLIDYDYCFLLEIGKGAVISAKTVIEFHDSCIPNVLGKGKAKIGRVKIGERAYVGVNSVILPGVKIGQGAIIGACSLVNRSVPSRQVWGGVPAKYICNVDELVLKRGSYSNLNVGNFDWIGESEKNNVNYRLYKKNLIRKVKKFFEIEM
jgi:maltose O-acetyltransferase